MTQTPELHTCRFAIRQTIRGTVPSARIARPQSAQKKFAGDPQGIELSEVPGIPGWCLCRREMEKKTARILKRNTLNARVVMGMWRLQCL